MVLAQPTAFAGDSVTVTSLSSRPLSHTQRSLFELISAVRNLRDEDDVQRLVFLATEFGVLQPSPFYFSRRLVQELLTPMSLVLRDALGALLECDLLRWEGGRLCAYGDLWGPERAAPHMDVTWLGALSATERGVLAQATLDLQRAEGNSHAMSSPSLRLLDGVEALPARALAAVR